MKQMVNWQFWTRNSFEYFWVLTLTCLLFVLYTQLFSFPWTGIDDSKIFEVYSGNLSNGHGFVYNVGGERVEGFTSLNWVLLGALGKIVFGSTQLAYLLFSLVFTAGQLFIVSKILQSYCNEIDFLANKNLGFWLPVIVVFAASLDPRYILWMVPTLMDGALWGFILIFGAWLFVERREPNWAWIKAFYVLIAVMTRPESMLYVPFLLMIEWILSGKGIPAKKDFLTIFGSYIFSILSLTLFRLLYFDSWLPNTYYAKASPFWGERIEGGLAYFGSYLFSGFWSISVGISILLLLLLGIRDRCLKKGGMGFSYCAYALVALCVMAFPVLNGGDHFAGFRFFQYSNAIFIVVLMLCVLVVSTLSLNFLRGNFRVFAGVLFLALVFGGVFCSHKILNQRNEFVSLRGEFLIAEYGALAGRILEQAFAGLSVEEKPTLGVINAGGVKTEYSGFCYDLLGLNWKRMAEEGRYEEFKSMKNHAAFSEAVFLEVLPDIVGFSLISPDRLEGYEYLINLYTKGMLASGDMYLEYGQQQISITLGSIDYIVVYFVRHERQKEIYQMIRKGLLLEVRLF